MATHKMNRLDESGKAYRMVWKIVQTSPGVRRAQACRLYEDGTERLVNPRAGVNLTQLKDGARKIGSDLMVWKGGAIRLNLDACLEMYRNEGGKWCVAFGMSDGEFVSDIVEMLKYELDERFDLSGTLEGANCCNVFGDAAEGLCESLSLTDEQAAKIRNLLLPEWLDTPPGEYCDMSED